MSEVQLPRCGVWRPLLKRHDLCQAFLFLLLAAGEILVGGGSRGISTRRRRRGRLLPRLDVHLRWRRQSLIAAAIGRFQLVGIGRRSRFQLIGIGLGRRSICRGALPNGEPPVVASEGGAAAASLEQADWDSRFPHGRTLFTHPWRHRAFPNGRPR